MNNKTKNWGEELTKKAEKQVKEHGLKKSNASPEFIWGLGFFEAIEFVKPFISKQIKKAKQKGLEKAIEICEELSPDYPELFQFKTAIEHEIDKPKSKTLKK